MAHHAKPRFKKGTEKWVALMPINLPDKPLNIGDVFDKGVLRIHVLRSMFLRGRVGPADHPWTAQALERRLARLGKKPEQEPAAEEPKEEPVVEVQAEEPTAPAEDKPKTTRRRTKAQTSGDS